MIIRLQKHIADCGICSRRKAEELITAGKIKVNGVIVRELGVKVDDTKDVVLYKDEHIKKSENLVYIMLNKPEGFVTTSKEQFNRPAVLDLLKNVKERVFPVGRLDYDTSGLLILTNDGNLTYKLTHPKHNIPKVYEAKLFGAPTLKEVITFKKGVVIDTGKTEPAKLEVVKVIDRFSICKITISEGKNRQIRKMCKAIKHPVSTLKRIEVGELSLGKLEKGAFRYLSKKEIAYLKGL